MRMTNDRWVSTPHRVVNPPEGVANTRRQSIPYFHNPDPDALVRCLEPFVSADRPARYEPITYRDYALQMTRRRTASRLTLLRGLRSGLGEPSRDRPPGPLEGGRLL